MDALKHKCDLWQMWTSDPRVPITRDDRNRRYFIAVSPRRKILVNYCPFCGNRVFDNKLDAVALRRCRHFEGFSRGRSSSIRCGRPNLGYWLHGSESLEVKLFFCPICGDKLPDPDDAGMFCKRSKKEVEGITKRFEGISTVDQAIKEFGPPEVRSGPLFERFFPGGKPITVGYRIALFYQHLARTVIVVVVEAPDGRLDLKFNQKLRNP